MLNSLICNATAKVIAEGKPANNEEALALTMPSGETLKKRIDCNSNYRENLIPSFCFD